MPLTYTYLNSPVRINFLLSRGDLPAMRLHSTFYRTVYFTDDQGTAIDLTGWSAVTTIRGSYDDPIILELTTENGGMILGTDGKVQWYATNEQTGALVITPDKPNRFPRSQRCIYDTKLEAPDGMKLTFAEGNIDIVDSVTR